MMMMMMMTIFDHISFIGFLSSVYCQYIVNILRNKLRIAGMNDFNIKQKKMLIPGVSSSLIFVQKKRKNKPTVWAGNPQQNAYVERCNRTVRYDWLELPVRLHYRGARTRQPSSVQLPAPR